LDEVPIEHAADALDLPERPSEGLILDAVAKEVSQGARGEASFGQREPFRPRRPGREGIAADDVGDIFDGRGRRRADEPSIEGLDTLEGESMSGGLQRSEGALDEATSVGGAEGPGGAISESRRFVLEKIGEALGRAAELVAPQEGREEEANEGSREQFISKGLPRAKRRSAAFFEIRRLRWFIGEGADEVRPEEGKRQSRAEVQMGFGDGIGEQLGELGRDERDVFAGGLCVGGGVGRGDEQIGRKEQGKPAPAAGALGQLQSVTEPRAASARLEVAAREGDRVLGERDVGVFVEEPGAIPDLAESVKRLAPGAGAKVVFQGGGERGGGFVEKSGSAVRAGEVEGRKVESRLGGKRKGLGLGEERMGGEGGRQGLAALVAEELKPGVVGKGSVDVVEYIRQA